jgi:murein L,D-transpeptidase YafK
MNKICSSSTLDSEMVCENIEDNGKRSSSTFKVKCRKSEKVLEVLKEKLNEILQSSLSEPTPTPKSLR